MSVTVASSLAGCAGGGVAIDPPDPAFNPAACEELMAQLPDSLNDQSAVPTDPESPLTAAWGDPAITLRCGVPTPDALTPDSVVYKVNGVAWFPEQLTAGYIFTSYDRVTNVEVTVPDDYQPEVDPVTELSDLVADTISPVKKN